MKRQFPQIERRALLGLAAALTTLGAACSPNNNVKPGAPVLTEVEIVENYGTASPAVTKIPSGVADCPAATSGADGAIDGGPAAGINGDMCDPAVTICRQTSAKNWCRCVPNSASPASAPAATCTDAGTPDAGATNADASPDAAKSADAAVSVDAAKSADAADAATVLGGTWNCAPFSPNSVALFVFDRLLDTVPLNPGDAGGVTTAATTMIAPPPAMPVAVTADYASNGSPNEVIFPLLGDLRSDGPSLLFAGQPELPTSSTVSITLDGTKVRAKDGKTTFTDSGFLAEGTLAFATAAFSATLTVPPPSPPSADAGACTPPPTTAPPDMTAATATFDNPVDPTTIGSHITITAMPTSGGGAPSAVGFTATSMDGLNVSITPNANWPASSTITITIDATAADLVGDTLGAAIPGTFTTSAM